MTSSFKSSLAAGSASIFAVLLSAATHAQSYHTYAQIESELLTIQNNYPAIAQRVYLGKTIQNRNMWAIKITDNVTLQEDEPEFCYISTMHGDEILGVEMCLSLANHLTSNYASLPRVQNIVNNMEVWIMPCMNPDGYVIGTRANVNGVDLNRNFPDPYTSPSNTTTGRQMETANIMNWRFGQSFVNAANFHGGALVVNYPFDNNPSGSSVYTASPDDDWFIWASEQYSQYNSPMWNSPTFFHGITNGADWYAVSGGMQDWGYHYMGCFEVTIELSDNKAPPASQIPTFWNQNRDSMLAYLESSLKGVRGIVSSAASGLPLSATVTVVGRNFNAYTDPDVGDYHRLLRPGTYSLLFQSPGHDSYLASNVVVGSGDATVLNVALHTPALVVKPNGGETLFTNRQRLVTWTGSSSAQFQVQHTTNYGALTSSTDTFESGSLGPNYSTGGNLAWSVTTSSAHGGTRSARSGAIGHNQSSWLQRVVSGPATVSFWRRVSSESGYDFFRFYVNGATQLSESGTVAWALYSTTLPAGTHTLRWEYSKDGSVVGGSDTCWVDDVQVVQDGTNWNDVIALTPLGATSITWVPTTSSTTAKVRVRAVYSGGSYGAWDESDALFIVTDPMPLLGDMDCNGTVSPFDITPFLAALFDPGAYSAAYPYCDVHHADMDQNGTINPFDIQEFLDLL